ncbi:Methyltransferase type 11 [Ktedonobacter racemifer DSM 44963]|uniref:Methyltransferase type 11 n=2 Tax=Ktedonobacter racemifer TaxID=363277 RepID=D6TSV0_KTERA|nr:Methyltransferase type 11 [Ktedonobacter racemifer DSM 44963]
MHNTQLEQHHSGRFPGGIEAMHIFLVRLLRWLGFTITGLVSLFMIGQIILRIRGRLDPKPMPPRFAFYLNSAFRRRLFGSLEQIVERAGVTPGMRVLEIGPGPGHFTTLLARRVAEQGKQGSVTCVELQPEMIARLRQQLHREQVNNVEIVQGDAQQLPLLSASFDMVFLATVIGEVPDMPALFSECARVLKPGGTLAVTEQLCDPDFRLPKTPRKLAINVGLQDMGYRGTSWWSYTASYHKLVA